MIIRTKRSVYKNIQFLFYYGYFLVTTVIKIKKIDNSMKVPISITLEETDVSINLQFGNINIVLLPSFKTSLARVKTNFSNTL